MRRPGNDALRELIGQQPTVARTGPKRAKRADRIEDVPVRYLPDFWTRALPDLERLYDGVCAYLGVVIPSDTGWSSVDHFVPRAKDRVAAYEWSNFRLATGSINAKKREYDDVLDPFEIEDGWFVLDFGTFDVKPGDGLGAERRAQVMATIKRLKLNTTRYRKARENRHDLYLELWSRDPEFAWEWVAENFPFCARELERQGRRRAASSAP